MLKRIILGLIFCIALSAGPRAQQLSGLPPIGNANLLMNGEMEWDQRNEGASLSTNAVYLTDGWKSGYTSAATIGNFARITSQVTGPAGFINYLRTATITTGSATVNAGDFHQVFQRIEGLKVNQLAWGQANASPATVSLLLMSNQASAILGISVQNAAQTRSFVHMCTTSATVSTWTTCAFTIPPDTTGTWLTSSAPSLRINITAECGSTFQGTADAWSSTNIYCDSTQTQISKTSSAQVNATAVKLEKGSVATPWVYLSRSQQYVEVARFYQKSFPVGTAPAQTLALIGATCVMEPVVNTPIGVSVQFSPPMNENAVPTITAYAPVSGSTQFYNATAAGVAGTFTVDSTTAKSSKGFDIIQGAVTASVAANLCVHWAADTNF
jgi:hypothetical protein